MDLIQIRQGDTVVVLQGAGMGVPYKGAALLPENGEGTTIVEGLVVSLAGAAGAIEGAVTTLQRLLNEAERTAGQAGAAWVYLEARVLAGGATWRSKVLSGWVELLGAGADQRKGGTQGLKLHLVRVNYWEESTEKAIGLTSLENGTASAEGVLAHNTQDGTRGNWVLAAGGQVTGDLPAPARLTLSSGYSGQGTVYAALGSGASAALLPNWQGEAGTAGAGVTKSNQASGAASGGSFARLSWSGTDDMALLEFGISGATVANMGSWPYLPVMRLANAKTVGERLWARWALLHRHLSGDNALQESRGMYLAESAALQAGAPLHAPPWPVLPGETQTGLVLQLRVAAAAAGAHTLDVDIVHLLPLEYWRIYRPALAHLGGLAIEDDAGRGVVKSYGSIQGHAAEGPGLWLRPGLDNRCYFLLEGMSGGVAVDTEIEIELHTRARKRVL